MAEESGISETNLRIWCDKEAQSPRFEKQNGNISKRTRTNNVAVWKDVGPWISWEQGEKQKTPDLKSIIQEVVDLDGWQKGNALTFIFEGSGSRCAVSYDDRRYREYAPKLIVKYKPRTAGQDPTDSQQLNSE